jgi:hypothetical protein
VRGMANAAAEAADIVVMTVPFAHHASTIRSVRDAVQGKYSSIPRFRWCRRRPAPFSCRRADRRPPRR